MDDLTVKDTLAELAANIERAINELNRIDLHGAGMTIVLGAYYKVILSGLPENDRALIEACVAVVAKRIEEGGKKGARA